MSESTTTRPDTKYVFQRGADILLGVSIGGAIADNTLIVMGTMVACVVWLFAVLAWEIAHGR